MSDPTLDDLNSETQPIPARRNKIPLWVKLAFTAFVAVMVPVYASLYGPWNFLFFCDVAVFVTLIGLWIESPLLISMEAVAILVPQIFWIADFTAQVLGLKSTGMTAYMFWPSTPVIAFEISLFHIWLPAVLLILVQRLGYDRRAILLQIPSGIALVLVCFLCFVPPDTTGSTKPAMNLNFVFGLPGYMNWPAHHPRLWIADLLAVVIFGFYLPTHFVLGKTLVKRPADAPEIKPQSDSALLPDATMSR